MSSRFKSPGLSLFVGRRALELGLRRGEKWEEVAKDFISLSVESYREARQRGR